MCPACITGLGKDKTWYWFCWDVLACVTPALSPVLPCVPMAPLGPAGAALMLAGVLGQAEPQLWGAEGTAEHPHPAGMLLTRKQRRKKNQTLAQQRRCKPPNSNRVRQRGGTDNTELSPIRRKPGS